jgi:diketogulonate reductase-like aldo/keto reductase
MAYCPLAQAGTLRRMRKDILTDETLVSVAAKYKISVMQIALAFTLRQKNLVAIPKSGSVCHVEENAAATDICISDEDWALIDSVYWPPTAKMHLDME